MYICPNCNATSEAPAKFCALCGTGMVESVPAEPVVEEQPDFEFPAQPAYQTPVQPQYQYQPQCQYQPQYQPQQQYQPEEPSKAKSIVSMVLSIVGATLAFIVFIVIMNAFASYYDRVEFFIVANVFGFISMALSIVGLSLSRGTANAFGKVGMIVGIFGLVASSSELYIAFFNTMYYI